MEDELGPAPYPLGFKDSDRPGLQLGPTIQNDLLKGYDQGGDL